MSFLPQYAIGDQDFVERIVTVTRHEKRKGQAWNGNQEIQGREVSLSSVGYHLLGSERYVAGQLLGEGSNNYSSCIPCFSGSIVRISLFTKVASKKLFDA